jgi:signal transduction histidine kinase
MRIQSGILTGILLCITVLLDAQNLITTYAAEEGLPKNTVTALYRDNEGYLWCGTSAGLAIFDGWEFHRPQISPEKAAPSLNTSIHGIIASSDGKSIWAGTDSVIVQMDRLTMKPQRSFDVIKSKVTIEAPVLANDTAVWVACNGIGLYRVRTSDGNATQLSASGCRQRTVAVLVNTELICFADSAGLIFISISTSGVRTLALPAGVEAGDINQIAELPGADQSVVLLTTRGMWRCDYSAGNFQRFYLNDETFDDTLSDFAAMIPHVNGTWWFAVNHKGVFEYNTLTKKMTLRGEQADTTFAAAAMICDEYGVVWCGSEANGLHKMLHGRYASAGSELICYRPPQLVASYIDGGQGKSGVIVETIIRDYGADEVVLSIWQTDFAFPERVLFNYQLEGTGEGYKQQAGLRELRYADLSSGFHSLICSVTVPGCKETPLVKLLTIKIVPPFWTSPWFIGIAVISIVLLLTIILFVVMRTRYQRKLRKLRMQQELDKIRARISRDIHDEIGAGLTRIALSGELMSQKADADVQQQEKLKWIAGTARELSQSMKEVVWSVNPHYDSLDHMAAYFRSYLSGVAENADLRFRYIAPGQLPAEEVNPETRRNLLLILKEAVSNAVKYSACTELKLEIQWSGGIFTMKISDNGRGFDSSSGSKVNSNGLRNIRQRSEAIGCAVKFTSAAGNGTTVEVSGPLSPKE